MNRVILRTSSNMILGKESFFYHIPFEIYKNQDRGFQ